MIHLLLCPHHLQYGGSQLSVHHWAKYLDKSKFKVSVLAMSRGELSEKFESHYPVYYDEDGYPNIARWIEELKPDIVHACPPGGPDMEYIHEAAKHITVTQTIMCPRPACNLEDVNSTVVPSAFSLSLQKNTNNIVHIEHPFDPSEYSAQFDRNYFGLPENKIIIGSLGNQRKENAHFMKMVRNYSNPGVHFVIRSDLRYPYFFGRNRITRIKNRLTEDEKMSLFKCMDIFLYPTTNEAYGIVFLEAMSQKCAIISYNDSAMPGTIDGAGLLSEPNNITETLNLLDKLVQNKDKREQLANTGYKLVTTRNNPENIARQYEQFFISALS